MGGSIDVIVVLVVQAEVENSPHQDAKLYPKPVVLPLGKAAPAPSPAEATAAPSASKLTVAVRQAVFTKAPVGKKPVLVGSEEGACVKFKVGAPKDISDSIKDTEASDRKTEVCDLEVEAGGKAGTVAAFNDSIVYYKGASTTYGVEYVTVGIPAPMYRRLVEDARKVGVSVDESDKVEVRGEFYAFNINLRNVDSKNLMAVYEEDRDGRVQKVPLRPLCKVWDSVKCNLLCCLIGQIRLKRQGSRAKMHSVKWTMGITLRSIIVKAVCAYADVADDDLDPNDMKQVVASASALSLKRL